MGQLGPVRKQSGRTVSLTPTAGTRLTTRRYRVLIADAQPTLRLGTSAALQDGGLLVVAQAGAAAEAVSLALARRPDMCVLDMSMPGGGLAAARGISTHLPDTTVLMLTDMVLEEELLAALRAGASGYLPKSTHPARLRAAAHSMLAGHAAMPRQIVLSLIDEIRALQPARQPTWIPGRDVRLTGRESQVVELLQRGLITRDIAVELGISVVTVRRHLSGALRKLGARDRGAALRLLGEARVAG